MHPTIRLFALSACLLAGSSGLFAETTPSAAPALARGLLMSHQGRLIFSPCRDRNYLDIRDASPAQSVTTALSRLNPDGQPLYVEFFATLDTGQLTVSGLNFAHTDARCHAPRLGSGWRALGAQSPWRLDTFNGQAQLTRADGSSETRAVTVQEAPDGSSRMTTDDTPGTPWQFAPKLCELPAQGIVTGWTAQGPAGPGCGWKP